MIKIDSSNQVGFILIIYISKMFSYEFGLRPIKCKLVGLFHNSKKNTLYVIRYVNNHALNV